MEDLRRALGEADRIQQRVHENKLQELEENYRKECKKLKLQAVIDAKQAEMDKELLKKKYQYQEIETEKEAKLLAKEMELQQELRLKEIELETKKLDDEITLQIEEELWMDVNQQKALKN